VGDPDSLIEVIKGVFGEARAPTKRVADVEFHA
jgi:hypothetical protein